jgi:ArsR family transcriptional regulator
MTERIPGNVRRRGADPQLWKWFRADGRLERMPAAPTDRRRVLERIAERFERGREYEEREVNVMLSQVDNDFATLRRYLIDERILEREKGRYRLR